MFLLKRAYIKHFPKAKEKYFLDQIKRIKYLINVDLTKAAEVHFKHSGLLGDIIYALPSMYALAEEKKICVHLNINKRAEYKKTQKHYNEGIMLTYSTVEFIAPLLLMQPNIVECNIYTDQHVDYDLDVFRNIPFLQNIKNIIRWNFILFGIAADLSKPWIHIKPNFYFSDEIVISRSFRYRTPGIDYSFLNKYPNLTFIGLIDEYDDMKKSLPTLKYQPVKNALEMAEIIAGCKFFIGNQSFPFSLAEGLKVKRVLEVCYELPNVVVSGSDGYDFYMQPQFEKIVHSLL